MAKAAPKAKPRRSIAVDGALGEAWAADAAREGTSLVSFVERAVEAVRSGQLVRPAGLPVQASRAGGAYASLPKVTAANCTNRLRAGTWCRECETIHKKGS